jgi:hypothetical protein
VDHLPGVADVFQIAAGVMTAAESERAPGHCLVERLAPGGELGANGGADDVGAVGVEAFLEPEGSAQVISGRDTAVAEP